MKTLRSYLKKAQKQNFAIGQFNFSTFEQVKGIIEAAKKLKSPIILGTSEGESKFVGLQEAVAVRNVLRKKTGLPIFLNLDHGHSFEYLREAIEAGYDMVHFDGSKLSLTENIKISKKVVAVAKKKGIVVEGEVGRIGTDANRVYEEKFEIKEGELTNVKDAELYMKKTKVDVLAVSVGTFHGMDIPGFLPHIRKDRLQEINDKISEVPLAIHGASGTSEKDLKEAIRLGVAKININTEIRAAFSNTLRKKMEIDKNEIVPYKYFPEAILAVQGVTEKYIGLFGSEGRA